MSQNKSSQEIKSNMSMSDGRRYSKASPVRRTSLKQPPSPNVARVIQKESGRGLTKSLLDQHEAFHEIDPDDDEQ